MPLQGVQYFLSLTNKVVTTLIRDTREMLKNECTKTSHKLVLNMSLLDTSSQVIYNSHSTILMTKEIKFLVFWSRTGCSCFAYLNIRIIVIPFVIIYMLYNMNLQKHTCLQITLVFDMTNCILWQGSGSGALKCKNYLFIEFMARFTKLL